MMSSPTSIELKEVLSYNPRTGVFTRIKKTNDNQVVGGIAGTLHHTGYCMVKVSGTVYGAHRLAWLYMTGEWPRDHIDHINHDRNDNRIDNLRVVTNSENQKNANIRVDNKSGVPGVYCRKGRWTAYVKDRCCRLYLGSFSNIFDAVCARKSAELKYGYHENYGAFKNARHKEIEE